jgi:hypothetical protein
MSINRKRRKTVAIHRMSFLRLVLLLFSLRVSTYALREIFPLKAKKVIIDE